MSAWHSVTGTENKEELIMLSTAHHTRRGFTLIELLVVIAIIAILAAILFPVFAKVREKARQTTCLSNLKQIGLAFTQYNQDNDESFPFGSFYGTLGQGWAGTIYPYVKSTGAFKCPDDSTGIQKNGNVISYPVSYSANLNFLRTDGSSADSRIGGLAISTLASPSKTVLLCEVKGIFGPITDIGEANGFANVVSSVTNVNPDALTFPFRGLGNTYSPGGNLMTGCLNGTDCSSRVRFPPYGEGFDSIVGLHTDGSNYLMCDCHAKWYRGARVSSGYVASAEDCNYNGTPALPDCPSVSDGMAAGTANSKFAVTFSTR